MDDEQRGKDTGDAETSGSNAIGIDGGSGPSIRCEVTDAASAVMHIAALGLRCLEVASANAAVSRAVVVARLLPAVQAMAEPVVARRRVLALDLALLRCAHLRDRLVEWEAGLTFGASWQGVKTAKQLSPEEEARLGMAQMLSEMLAQPVDLCVKALEVNNDNADMASMWLMEGHGDAFAAGGGLSEGPQDRTDNDARMKKAMQLAQTFGKPPNLVVRALEMFQDNENRAAEWLMEAGDKYIPGMDVPFVPPRLLTGRGCNTKGELSSSILRAAGLLTWSARDGSTGRGGNGADASNSTADDSAAVEDLDVGEVVPMVQECNPARLGSLLEGQATIRRGGRNGGGEGGLAPSMGLDGGP